MAVHVRRYAVKRCTSYEDRSTTPSNEFRKCTSSPVVWTPKSCPHRTGNNFADCDALLHPLRGSFST
eukprot:30989-Pelagococcus_subviridis.AAC.9